MNQRDQPLQGLFVAPIPSQQKLRNLLRHINASRFRLADPDTKRPGRHSQTANEPRSE
jgi:hypothetical protein